LKLVRSAEALLRAEDLYVGRGFNEARAVAERLRASFFVASAGLGLVSGDTRVPAYDLTVSGTGGASIDTLLSSWSAAPADWWMALAEAKGEVAPLCSLVEGNAHARFFIALPSTYISLVSLDLACLSASSRRRLCIFTSPHGVDFLPASLRDRVMPYDDRLEATRWSGTRADFAQRALRHFVDNLDAVGLPFSEAASRVRATMQALRPRTLPTRQRKTDLEIAEMLWEKWARFDGNASRLLRFLRDDALVSCEQSRFRRLCLSIRAKRDPIRRI